MTGAEQHKSPDDVMDSVLAARDRRNRRRRLRRRRAHFSPELVGAFCQRARAGLRTDPAHAYELGELALLVAAKIDDDDATFAAHHVLATVAVVAGEYPAALRALDAASATEHVRRTPHDAARIQQVRRSSKFLVTIGACATAGGIQALRNFKDVQEFVQLVYPTPALIDTLAQSTPRARFLRESVRSRKPEPANQPADAER